MRSWCLFLAPLLLSACSSGDSPAIDAAPIDGTPDATVTVTLAGSGTGTVTSSPAGIDCPGTCSYAYPPGTTLTLHAAPGTGAVFVGWTAGGCSGTGDCTVAVGSNLTVEATFSSDRTLTVVKTGNGNGTVTSSPAGIDCGATCSAAFGDQQMVTLTAVPGAGSSFTGWIGGGCTGTGTCTVTMTQDLTVTATFAVVQHLLTVTKTGTGSGTVTSSPAGISCGATCSHAYDQGTTVVLTATPGGNSTFAGWSGACTGTGTCTVTMTAARNVTAAFTTTVSNLTCTIVNNAVSCTNGAIPEINLGPLSGPQCQAACPGQMSAAGMTSGCWIVAINTNCYCRSGALNLGSDRPGGVCS